MKKILKNKNVVIAIIIVILSIIYFSIDKIIKKYNYSNDYDIIAEETKEDDKNNENINKETKEKNIESLSEEETDLITEEIVEENKKQEETEIRKIYVYVTGEVNNPGVVILNQGSRIVDAIKLAGGTTEKANVSKINFVYVLEDGMKINIPNDNDLKNNLNFEYITTNSGDGANEVSNTKESQKENNSPKERNTVIVNINTATQTELETLPGIGPSIALKIINYRKENGKFNSIEEIKNINGIGDNKFESIKKYIKV